MEREPAYASLYAHGQGRKCTQAYMGITHKVIQCMHREGVAIADDLVRIVVGHVLYNQVEVLYDAL